MISNLCLQITNFTVRMVVSLIKELSFYIFNIDIYNWHNLWARFQQPKTLEEHNLNSVV